MDEDLAVLGELRVAAEPGVTRFCPDGFIRRDIEAGGASFFKLLEVALVAPGVNDGVFVALTSAFVKRSAVNLRVVAGIHIPCALRQQEDVILERELAAGVFGAERPFEHVGAAFCVHSDQAVVDSKRVAFEGMTPLFTARKPHKRPVDQDVGHAAAVAPVVLYGVVSGMFDVRTAKRPVGGVALKRNAVTGVDNCDVLDRNVRSIGEIDAVLTVIGRPRSAEAKAHVVNTTGKAQRTFVARPDKRELARSSHQLGVAGVDFGVAFVSGENRLIVCSAQLCDAAPI